MKKVLVLGVLFASLSISSVFASVNVFMKGEYVDFKDAKPTTVEGRAMVPVATISKQLGIDYTWDAATQTVTFKQEDKELSLKVGEQNSFVKNGRTYVPLRFIAESFGQEVDWREDRQTVVIGENARDVVVPIKEIEETVEGHKHIDQLKKEKFMDYANPNAPKYPTYNYIEGDYIKSDTIQNIAFSKKSDLPIQVGNYTIYSIELERRSGADYISVKQSIPYQTKRGLKLTIVDKDWNTFRARNSIENFSEATAEENVYITYYPVMDLNDSTFEDLKYLQYKLPTDFYIILNANSTPNALVLEGKGGKIQ